MKFEDKEVLDLKIKKVEDGVFIHFHIEDDGISDGKRVYGIKLARETQSVGWYVKAMKAFVQKFEKLNGEEIPWPESIPEEV